MDPVTGAVLVALTGALTYISKALLTGQRAMATAIDANAAANDRLASAVQALGTRITTSDARWAVLKQEIGSRAVLCPFLGHPKPPPKP